MILLSIDPGKRACGAALFWDGELSRAAFVKSAGPATGGPALWRQTASAVLTWVEQRSISREGVAKVVFERMPAYRTDLPSKTLNLQDLVAVCAWICALFPGAEHAAYFPREWEGTLNRKGEVDPVIARVQGRLSVTEHARVQLPCASLAHNVWDSVGIGLKALGRFEPHREIRRA